MTANSPILDQLLQAFAARIPEGTNARIPPHVFTEMAGEVLAYDSAQQTLSARYPVQTRYQNPLGLMQGGMIAAAIDNTLGPLSFIVAPPSVTKKLEVTYRRPVTPDIDFIHVEATLAAFDGYTLQLEARVTTPNGKLLATCRAEHVLARLG